MSSQEEIKDRLPSIAYKIMIIIIGLSIGAFHCWHVSSMFENDRGFSQLTTLEKEISLRTEMGFYYSFYKTVVEEKVLVNGISKLVYNRQVEYPDEVNAINRFNIYPEIVTGGAYRYVRQWQPRASCVEPIVFYLRAVWGFAGATLLMLFLSAVALCGNAWGGLLCALEYLANHAECTRVMWAPNERENWAQPLLLAQMALVTAQLRRKSDANAVGLQTTILFLNCLCLLFWQFSQFILLTQLAIIFMMEQLCVINTHKLMLLLHSHFCGLHMAVLFTQGNDMLLTSFYASFFAVVSFYALFLSGLRVKSIERRSDVAIESWLILIRVSIVVTASFWLKSMIGEFFKIEEDSHIFDILLSKFTSFKSFHTMLYTCSPTYAFLPTSYFSNVTKTGLLPLATFGILNVLYHTIAVAVETKETKAKKKEKKHIKMDDGDDSGIDNPADSLPRKRDRRRSKTRSVKEEEKSDHRLESNDKEKEDKSIDKAKQSKEKKIKKKYHKWVLFLRSLDIDAGIFYNASQMFVFGIMAILIMRLKLLFTPHLCIVASLSTQPQYYNRSLKRYKRPLMLIAVVLAAVAGYHGYKNFIKERSYYGDAYDPELTELLEWVSTTHRDAVFSASMPLSAAVWLSTRRAIVVHPHYEHHKLRQRVYSVYKMYGRFSPLELYSELSRMKVTHLVVDYQNCYSKSNMGCTFEEIWRQETPTLTSHRPRICHLLITEEVPHFYKVFQNAQYTVLRVHDYSLRYTPRLLET